MSTGGNLILRESVKHSLCGYVIMTFFVKRIITVTFLKKINIFSILRRNKALRSTLYNQTFSSKEMDIKPNVVDYKIWGIMQDTVYACKFTSVDELKQRISDEWDKIDQQLIDSAIKQWHKRLAVCVSA